MPLITEADIRARAYSRTAARHKSAEAMLREGRDVWKLSAGDETFTVFLCHSFNE
jgi:hypothetical protein